jgi:hypothetical protein
MSVQGVSGGQSSSQLPATLEITRQTLVLKKEQDAARIEAQALTDLIKSAGANATSAGINVYA